MSARSTLAPVNYRPLIHYAPRANWMNDPNGLLYYQGLYHLYYQYNPQGDTHGHMHWGRATSPDLIHWAEHDIALHEHEHEIFSGSAVVDWHNTSGFGKTGDVPLVACYTGHTQHNQAQFLAYSLDGGERWTPHPETVLDMSKKDFRDPKVFWHEPSGQWIMAIVHPNERQIELFRSPDLHHWTSLSVFGPAGVTEGIWEVPELFPVQDDAGQIYWVMKVDFNPGGLFGGSGAQYWLGEFNGVTFTPTTEARWVDHGKDFYAALTWNELPERRVWIAWMNNWQYAQQVPTPGQRGMMSLPRELRVVHTQGGPRLAQCPVLELQQLRQDSRPLQVHTPIEAGQALELQLSWEAHIPLELEFHSAAGLECRVAISPTELSLTRPSTDLTSALPGYTGTHRAPLQPLTARQDLRLFLDTCSIEVFANGGCSVISDLLYPAQPIREVILRSPDLSAANLHAEVWTLK